MTLARTIAAAALEKRATDVVILDLRELDAVTDCFVICTGDVNQQVRAIAENIERQVKSKTDDRLLHREGMDALNWVILDYVNVVAHVFKPSFREFYRLENLWGDAELIHVRDKAAAPAKVTEKRPATKKTLAKPPTGDRVSRAAVKKPAKKAPAAKRASAKRTKR